MSEPVYCIIGATGFLGRHLIRHLATSNVQHVRCLSRKEQEPTASLEWLVGNLHEKRTLQGLITKDAIVINLGFDVTANHDANVTAARALGRVCVTAQAQSLIHVSTATVVGGARDNMIDESTPCTPISDYEQTKLDIEVALSETKCALSTTVVRPTAVFGEGGRNLLKLAQSVAGGNAIYRHLSAYAHGTRCMNLVALENVVAAITYLAMAPSEISCGTFIVSDDDSANNDYAYVESRLAVAFGRTTHESMAQSLPVPLLRLLLKTVGRSNTNPHRRYSCKKLLDAGFTRPVKFEDALDAYAAHLAARWTQLHQVSG